MSLVEVAVSFVDLSPSPYLRQTDYRWEGFKKRNQYELQTYSKESAMSRLVEGGVQVHSYS